MNRPVLSPKAAQKRAARVIIEAKLGRPMTNKAAKKWIKRQLRKATRPPLIIFDEFGAAQ